MEAVPFKKAKKEFRAISALFLMHGILPLLVMFLLNFVLLQAFMPVFKVFQIHVMLAYLIPMLMTILLSFFGWLWLKPPIQKRHFRWQFPKFWKYAMFLLGINFFCSIVLNGIQAILHPTGVVNNSVVFSGNSIFDFLILAYVIVIGPIFEELLLRGVVLRTLDKYHRTFAILVSSILFGMMHLNLMQTVATFFVGCVLAYASLKEDSLLLPIGLHMLNNLISVLSMIPVLSILMVLSLFACYIGMVVLVHKHMDQVPALFAQEFCTYSYGRLFFSRWTTIVYLIFFVFAMFLTL